MKAIILAAGRGSRMGNLTIDKPKCLLQYNHKPLIENQISALQNAGISEIGLVCGYRSELLSKYGSHHFFNFNWSKTNMVYSLLQASQWLQEDACIISYSDIVYSTNAVKRLIDTKSDIAITYDPNWLRLWSQRFSDPLSDAETFKIDDNGFLLTIGDRANNIQEIEGQYMGLLKITPNGFAKICSFINNQNDDYVNKLSMTQLLQNLININIKIETIAIDDFWYEFDSEKDLASVID